MSKRNAGEVALPGVPPGRSPEGCLPSVPVVPAPGEGMSLSSSETMILRLQFVVPATWESKGSPEGQNDLQELLVLNPSSLCAKEKQMAGGRFSARRQFCVTGGFITPQPCGSSKGSGTQFGLRTPSSSWAVTQSRHTGDTQLHGECFSRAFSTYSLFSSGTKVPGKHPPSLQSDR